MQAKENHQYFHKKGPSLVTVKRHFLSFDGFSFTSECYSPNNKG